MLWASSLSLVSCEFFETASKLVRSCSINESFSICACEKKEEVAEAYMAEFAKCNEAMMNELVKECESIMAGPAQPGQA